MPFFSFAGRRRETQTVALSADHRVRLERAATFIDRNPRALADDLAARFRSLAHYDGRDVSEAIRRCVSPVDEIWFASQLGSARVLSSVFHAGDDTEAGQFARELAERAEACADAQRLVQELTELARREQRRASPFWNLWTRTATETQQTHS